MHGETGLVSRSTLASEAANVPSKPSIEDHAHGDIDMLNLELY